MEDREHDQVFVRSDVVDLDSEALDDSESNIELRRRVGNWSAHLRTLECERENLFDITNERVAETGLRSFVVLDGVLVLDEGLGEKPEERVPVAGARPWASMAPLQAKP